MNAVYAVIVDRSRFQTTLHGSSAIFLRQIKQLCLVGWPMGLIGYQQ